MTRTFMEVVLKTDARFAKGFLQGYLAGSGKAHRFFINEEAGIEAESLSEKLKELVGLADLFQRVVIEEDFLALLHKDSAAAAALGLSGQPLQARRITSGSFSVRIKDSAQEDAAAIKKLLSGRPAGVTVEGWQERETIEKNGRGVELYTPLHDYVYEASGSFRGPIEALADLRSELGQHASVKTGLIKLVYEE